MISKLSSDSFLQKKWSNSRKPIPLPKLPRDDDEESKRPPSLPSYNSTPVYNPPVTSSYFADEAEDQQFSSEDDEFQDYIVSNVEQKEDDLRTEMEEVVMGSNIDGDMSLARPSFSYVRTSS